MRHCSVSGFSPRVYMTWLWLSYSWALCTKRVYLEIFKYSLQQWHGRPQNFLPPGWRIISVWNIRLIGTKSTIQTNDWMVKRLLVLSNLGRAGRRCLSYRGSLFYWSGSHLHDSLGGETVSRHNSPGTQPGETNDWTSWTYQSRRSSLCPDWR